jgi:hypothetical protein
VIIIADFDEAGQLLIIYSTLAKYVKKLEFSKTVYHLFVDS